MDEAKFWTRVYRTARRDHTCELCGRVISAGERYLYGTGCGDSFWHWKECAHCEWMQTTFDISYDGAYNGEMLAEFEPRDIVGCRALAGFRMRWRARGGSLVRIPSPEQTQENER